MRPFRETIEPRILRAILFIALSILMLAGVRCLKRAHPSSDPPAHFEAIEVRGDVRDPGVYFLRGEAPTVMEALDAAGGLKSGRRFHPPPGAAAERPAKGSVVRVEERKTGTVGIRIESMGAAAILTIGGRLDINSAGERDLLAVPRMKPDVARAIVERRGQKAWERVEDVDEIPGVGPKTAEKWKDYLEVKRLQ